MEKISYIEKDEQGKQRAEEFQEVIQNANIEDLIQPEVWKYLSQAESKMLRRWVNKFIKANQENEDKEVVAYPQMNRHLRRAIERVTRILWKQKATQIAQGMKEAKGQVAKNE
ncbi:MAG: hypothetical protein J6Q89_06455 [Clostridia bacterium]|nr:hypothetical protein [Clostridia bacterium]